MGNAINNESELPEFIISDVHVQKWMTKISLREREIKRLYKMFEENADEGFLSVEKLFTQVLLTGRSPAAEEMVRFI
jgi:hypothetical protein